tara:strand:+ start:213 stop:734 length:522 start_codon:yes stop_codon:yes gene_type:complete
MAAISKKNQAKLSHAKLTELLHYDAKTGIFIRIKGQKRKIAGSQRTHDISICVNGISYAAHRLAWFYVYEKWPTLEIDHIDQNPKNNRIANLRQATRSQNAQNISYTRRTHSGITGVVWDNTWKAVITVNRKEIVLGKFSNIKDAIKARILGVKKYHSHAPKNISQKDLTRCL